ncbi:MAG: hypothetical protein ACMG6E_02270, partial [Candidatus Roizmanbacteria bacterium]
MDRDEHRLVERDLLEMLRETFAYIDALPVETELRKDAPISYTVFTQSQIDEIIPSVNKLFETGPLAIERFVYEYIHGNLRAEIHQKRHHAHVGLFMTTFSSFYHEEINLALSKIEFDYPTADESTIEFEDKFQSWCELANSTNLDRFYPAVTLDFEGGDTNRQKKQPLAIKIHATDSTRPDDLPDKLEEINKKACLSLVKIGMFPDVIRSAFEIFDVYSLVSDFDLSHIYGLSFLLQNKYLLTADKNQATRASGVDRTIEKSIYLSLFTSLSSTPDLLENCILGIINEKGRGHLDDTLGYLFYFYAGCSKETITQQALLTVLNLPLSSLQKAEILLICISNDKKLNPDSHLADQLKGGLFPGTALILLRHAIDTYGEKAELVLDSPILDTINRTLETIDSTDDRIGTMICQCVNACMGKGCPIPDSIDKLLDRCETIKFDFTFFGDRALSGKYYKKSPLYQLLFEGTQAFP